jgi:hypothetical protein
VTFEAWTPIRVDLADGAPVVDWCHTAGVDFGEPFFDESVERCLRHPFRLLFRRRTGIDALAEAVAERPGLAPSGFVLHLSRSGSTLVASMLAALPSTLVLSEPRPLDTVLRTGRADWVRAMVAALGRPRRPGQRHLVVKLDAWAVFQLPALVAAFPGVPVAMVHRDPVEVLVSQERRRGWHMVPGTLDPAVVGVADPTAVPPEDHLAAVLGALCRAAAAHLPAGSLLVDHRDLPGAVPDAVAPHFGIPCDGPARADVLRVAALDAKNPFVPFEDDRAAKRSAASPALRAAAERWVAEPYEALLARRAG